MTLITAWKNDTTIFVTGDSVVTRRPNIHLQGFNLKTYKPKLKTNFDEEIVFTETELIEESVIKIHNIQDKLIIGYAGFGNSAVDVINSINEQIAWDLGNIREIIDESAVQFGNNFQLVVGYFINGKPILLTYNLNGDHKFHDEHSWALLGSGRNHEVLKVLSIETMDFFTNKAKSHNSPNEILIQFCTLMQSIILRGEFIREGVGGFYTGGFLTNSRFSWQNDTGYITFLLNNNWDPDNANPNLRFSNPRFIFLFHRENKVAILSMDNESGYKTVEVFFPYINSFDLQLKNNEYKEEYIRWLTRHQKIIRRKIRNFKMKYFVFFSYDKQAPNKMTFIHNYCGAGKFIFDIKWDKEIPILDISSEFVKEIDPRTAEYLNEFFWLTKHKLGWYLRHLLIWLTRPIYFFFHRKRVAK